MPPNETAPIIQHAIQLAIAPVFLLTGIAGLLGVMANCLARIVDRARDLELRWTALDEKALAAARVEIGRQTSVDSVRNMILTFPEIRDVDPKGRYKP